LYKLKNKFLEQEESLDREFISHSHRSPNSDQKSMPKRGVLGIKFKKTEEGTTNEMLKAIQSTQLKHDPFK